MLCGMAPNGHFPATPLNAKLIMTTTYKNGLCSSENDFHIATRRRQQITENTLRGTNKQQDPLDAEQNKNPHY